MIINKDTKIFASFSSNPGNNGCTYFNTRFQEEGIDAIYKSFKADSLKDVVCSIKTLGIKGFALSMPFKHEILEYASEYGPGVNEIQAANTVTNKNGWLKAYNTDWLGVQRYLKERKINSLSIIGDGGFSKAIQYCCKENNYPYEVITRDNWETINTAKYHTFNATPLDIELVDTDGRPHTYTGKLISKYQAEEQYNIYLNG